MTLSYGEDEVVLAGDGVPVRASFDELPSLELEAAAGLLTGDAALNAREREAAAALCRTLGAGVRDRLASLGSGVLGIDGPDLPWELVEDVPVEDHPVGGFTVVRIATGGQVRGKGVEVRVWSPSGDAGCAGVAGALDEAVLRPGDRPTVLHVVCHGRDVAGRLALVLDGGDQAPDTLRAVLEPALQRCRLVVLDVCGSGAVGETPARRLLAAGIGVVIAPQRPWGLDAAQAFSSALYADLRGGSSVIEAVRSGRRALRRLGVAHPSCRWWNPTVWVSDEEALSPLADEETGVEFPLPPGTLRHARPSGYLGVEHLLLALAEDTEDPWLAVAGPLLRDLAAACPRFVAEGWAGPTPRLKRWACDDRDALIIEVLAVPWVSLDAVLIGRFKGGTETRTLTAPTGLDVVDAPGLTLEVQGGPEDGRRIAMRHRGDVIGRWDPAQTRGHRLYPPPLPQDPTLSRRAAVWEGGAGLRFRGRLVRAGVEEPVDGVTRLLWGDRIRLGAGTLLAVVGVGAA